MPKKRGRPAGRKNTRQSRGTQTQSDIGAYRNAPLFRRNLQPFVETKDVETFQVAMPLDNSQAFNIYTPDCFMYKTQGVGEGNMVGDSCYSRYLTTKMLMKFPQGQNQIVTPTQIIIYKVFIKAPIAATDYTNPAISVLSKTDLENHIANQCREFYNAMGDRLEFSERLKGIKILQKHVVRPRRESSISIPSTQKTVYVPAPGGGQAPDVPSQTHLNVIGGPPDVYMKFSWPVKGKLNYDESANLSSGNTHFLNRPPSKMGYPALIIFNPDFAGQTVVEGQQDAGLNHNRTIKYEARSKHWYGDQ